MTTEGATVREQTRQHRAKGARKRRVPGTSERILAGYHEIMRVELVRLLRLIAGDWQGKPASAPDDRLLPLAERAKYWDLAIKLARELGNEIDVTPPAEEPTPITTHVARADFG